MFYFQRDCIRGFYGDDVSDCEKTVAFIFENLVLKKLLKLAAQSGCMNLSDLIECNETCIKAILGELATTFADSWEDLELPVRKKTNEFELLGVLYTQTELSLFWLTGLVDTYELGDGWIEKMSFPEDRVGLTEPLLSSDQYGNVNGYTSKGRVCLIPGDDGWSGVEWEGT